MDKIATTQELQSALQRLLDYAQSRRPSRVHIARELSRLSERVAAPRRRPSLEEQLKRLNSPRSKGPKKPLRQRVFGCEIAEEGGEFVVYKDGKEVGRAKDRRAAQEIAHANW